MQKKRGEKEKKGRETVKRKHEFLQENVSENKTNNKLLKKSE